MPHIRQIILGPRILHFLSGRIEDEVDFRNLEACDFDLEPHGDEALQLDLEDFLVPAAFSAKRLSAIKNARFCTSERPDAVTVGTVRNPSKLAAASRPCPARMTPFSSIKIGTRWPKALMLSAICRI